MMKVTTHTKVCFDYHTPYGTLEHHNRLVARGWEYVGLHDDDKKGDTVLYKRDVEVSWPALQEELRISVSGNGHSAEVTPILMHIAEETGKYVHSLTLGDISTFMNKE